MRYFLIIFLFVCVATVSILGFRGSKSSEPPIYVFPDMDDQAKYKPQASNEFFSNGMDSRPPVPGAIARGQGYELEKVLNPEYAYPVMQNEVLYTGLDPKTGEFYRGYPMPVTMDLMKLGQQKYNLICSVCHGLAGNGNGIAKSYGMIAIPCYHRDKRFDEMAEGEYFHTITYGKGQMMGYADKLTPEERWAIILYIRALLLSQDARIEDVPENLRANLPEIGK